MPLLPDFEAVVLVQFRTPARACRWSSVSRRLANVSEAGRIGCERPPPLDQSMAALVSPAGSALGPTSCPSRDCRTMDGFLLRTHSAMAIQTKLATTTAILSLYLRHLSHVAEGTMEEIQLVSSLLSLAVKEQAIAAGKVITSLWVARRHLWLAQSRFQPADRTSLTGLVIEPTSMFGSGALTMLQQAQEARRYASELSGPLAYPHKSRHPRAPHVKLCRLNPVGAQGTLGSSWLVVIPATEQE